MLVNLTGGPFDGQTKNIKQRTNGNKLLPMAGALTWPVYNEKRRAFGRVTYTKQQDGTAHIPAEYTYNA